MDSFHRVVKNAVEIIERIRTVVDEAADLSQKRLEQADRVVGDTLARAQRIGEAFERGTARPVREILAVAAGVSAALRVLFEHHKTTPARGPEVRKISLLKSLLVLAVLPAFGWQALPLNAQDAKLRISYEGQKIDLVDLVARPAIDVESLRPLIAQKAGEPYSDDKVQSTVAALMRAGQFSKVDVEVTPKPAGLQVLFVLQPAYYIGMISFPGAEKAFAYSRLLEAVSYPAQEPYDAKRVQAAVPGLVHFFAENGYFAANVRGETNFDDPHHLAHLIYHVTLNKRAKFGQIVVNGPPAADAARLANSLRSFHALLKGASLKQGKPYDPGRLRAATTFLQDTLGNEDRLASQVRLEPPEYRLESNRADVVFQVTLGPKVSVNVTGASISKRELKKLIPIYDEKSVDSDLVQEGKRNLANHFQGEGYTDVTVQASTDNQGSQVAVNYQVNRGVKHNVGHVTIAGNHRFKESDLKAQVLVEKGELFSHGEYSQDLVKRSVNNLTAYYRNRGYADVKVQPEVVNRDHTLNVTFEIAEGPQTVVGSFRIEGNTNQTVEALAPHGLKLGEGQPYSRALLEEDRSRIVASYMNLGYANMTFQSRVEPLPGKDSPRVGVTYTIDEGPQTRISQVDYMGARHTRASFMQRNTTVRPGAPLSEGAMLESESKLYTLGDFDWASVAPLKPVTDQTTEEVLVKVHEEPLNSITYGFGFLSTARAGSLSSGVVTLPGLPTVGLPKNFTVIEKNVISPSGSLEYSRLDLFGEGQTASVSTFLSVLDQKGTFTHSIPQLEGSKWNMLWSGSGERTTMNPLFAALIEMGSLKFSKDLDATKTKRLQLRYEFQHTTLSDLLIENFVPSEDLAVRDSLVGATFTRDTRDKPLDAHKGFFQSADLSLVPKAIGSSDNFARFLGQASFYKQVAPRLVWANNFRLGFEKAFGGSHVPFSEQFFSGGPDTLRGFPLNGAGPQQTAVLCTKADDPSTCTADITVPTGGRQLVIFNTEGRFPLPAPLPFLKDKLGGAIFYDGGNVYHQIGFGNFFNDWTNSVGVGLRYQTPVGPVRIDLGRNLSPVPGLKATEIFVTLGQAF